jgi:iron complex transport system substrate-binding protein
VKKEKMKKGESTFGKMKTKAKIVAWLGIAIVLCSLFLVTIPGIAAEQTAQKVSASTVTTTSEDDYVLGIYGNANEDDTIDMRDLTYVKLIFFGERPEAELADAKYDGELNPLDFVQIKLIIVGKEKELTIIDTADKIVTMKKPVERIVSISHYCCDALRMLGDMDKVIAIAGDPKWKPAYFPQIVDLPSIGGYPPDLEAIVSFKPDLVLGAIWWTNLLYDELPSDIPVVGLNFMSGTSYEFAEETVKLGYIMNRRDEAHIYLNNFHDKYLNYIKAQTENLSDEDKPKVYVESSFGKYKAYGGHGSGTQIYIEISGGKNIFEDSPLYFEADPEAVLAKNPDIIIKQMRSDVGYSVDDFSAMEATREEIMHRPELFNVSAVKSGKVYIIDEGISYGINYPIAVAYMAKWLHPELFDKLGPQAMHQEYLEFLGIDYDLDKHGVFVYPSLED